MLTRSDSLRITPAAQNAAGVMLFCQNLFFENIFGEVIGFRLSGEALPFSALALPAQGVRSVSCATARCAVRTLRTQKSPFSAAISCPQAAHYLGAAKICRAKQGRRVEPFRPFGAPPLTQSGEARKAIRLLLSLREKRLHLLCLFSLNLRASALGKE